MATVTPKPAADMPAEQVAAEAVLRASQRSHEKCGNEDEVVADGDAIYLLRHPELCSTDADYPGWAAALAARTNQLPGGTR